MNPAHVNVQSTWWASAWPVIQPYLPLFALVVAIIIPLSASFLGAWTAQRIAERNRFRDDLTKEIRNTNAALAVAFTVCNTGMALKRQHVQRISKEFEESKTDFVEHMRKRERGEIQGNTVYRFLVHLMTINPPKLATESLRSMVLDRLSAVGRPLHLAVEINESADRLIVCLDGRNEVIAELKASNSDGLGDDGSAQRFFGLKFGGGHQDLTFPHLLDGITRSTDDVIFFAYLLCEDLRKHGNKLVEKYRARFGGANAPHITEMDFSPRLADETIPSRDQYKDWIDNFIERPAPPSRWQRMLHPIASRRLGT